jgi:hypothetical protein
VLHGLADIELESGHVDLASAIIDDAESVAVTTDDLPVLGSVLALRALLAGHQDDPERAAWLLGRSTAVRGRLDMSDPHLRRFVGKVRARLGEPRYLAEVERGASCGREAVIADVRAAHADTARSG